LNHNFTLALIAHDRKKEELADFVIEHRAALSRFHLLATTGTGSHIERCTGLTIHLLEHGAADGDRQLGELAEDNEVQAVIFFRDPVSAEALVYFLSSRRLRIAGTDILPLMENTSPFTRTSGSWASTVSSGHDGSNRS
jgi:methylglyoxal synthase